VIIFGIFTSKYMYRLEAIGCLETATVNLANIRFERLLWLQL